MTFSLKLHGIRGLQIIGNGKLDMSIALPSYYIRIQETLTHNNNCFVYYSNSMANTKGNDQDKKLLQQCTNISNALDRLSNGYGAVEGAIAQMQRDLPVVIRYLELVK